MSAAALPEAVSSSSTLWATASKEWVIPAKPKPGRKPKKDVAPPPQDAAENDKGRRVQNRAAQRAFRERKQSQLAELQARLQQYEQGEIERNVALQNIAKRLKEENEKLRQENAALKAKVTQYEERAAQKRARDEASSYDLSQSPAKKRNKVTTEALNNLNQMTFPPVSYASSPSAISSADSSDAHSSFSPVPMPQSARDTPIFPQAFGLNGIFDMATSGKTSLFEPGGSLDTFDCGLCSDNTPCFCRELALQQVNERMAAVNSVSSMKIETGDQIAAPTSASPSSAQQTSSILDNLPAYQAPVPLRRRAPANPSLQPIFPIVLPSAEPSKPEVPSCTGDPSNCPACADDAFGKAFCAAISKSVAGSTPCKDCPGRGEGGCCGGSSSTGSGCCGNPGACGQSRTDSGGNSMAASGSGTGAASAAAPLTSSLLMSEPLTTTETIPCDAAWRQIKSHPNAAFTDLSLLAEVVARRTKCTGPRVEISPAPGTITPERGLSPGVGLPSYTQQQDSQPIILTDPHAQYHERQRTRANGTSSPPQLVPQEVLVKCGRQRVREVMADGVRDALRLLDARFAVP
ncbi:hypothetical protein PYCCODRAFT_1470225 [Trametes coccinea BRFM310]|uniref:BZIP domain-containing protein n=1 Tax=Trametes coccinea (strain BRFM310) TaxID=1353009 RepID=A0A1Y2IEI8_TRAC3|nr:hypothetical protein PYCCODRAFT_1470225 [Trametes coccinea BRFM310]